MNSLVWFSWTKFCVCIVDVVNIMKRKIVDEPFILILFCLKEIHILGLFGLFKHFYKDNLDTIFVFKLGPCCALNLLLTTFCNKGKVPTKNFICVIWCEGVICDVPYKKSKILSIYVTARQKYILKEDLKSRL